MSGRRSAPSLPSASCRLSRILRRARYSAPDCHQHTRPKVSRFRPRHAHGDISCLDFEVRIRRLPAKQPHAVGQLEIAKKIGDNAPLGAVFKDRIRTGEVVAPNSPGRDPIVTRILWLRGREAQNANAFGRYIYIHGTPEERLIGMPASYGCIRMRSTDVVQLYNIVGVGAAVTIVDVPLVSAVPGMVSAHSMGSENTPPFVMR
jgi:L,D-transpeptidase catalytic domain